MTAMLHGLISDIADEIRRRFRPDPRSPMMKTIRVMRDLRASGLLDHAVIEVLLRRADEEQSRPRSGPQRRRDAVSCKPW